MAFGAFAETSQTATSVRSEEKPQSSWWDNITDGIGQGVGTYVDFLLAKETAKVNAQLSSINARTQVDAAQAAAANAQAQADINRAANTGWQPWMTYTALGLGGVVSILLVMKFVK